MATKFHQDVDKLLECSVCLEQIKEPKMLTCQHTFCLEPCLMQMAKSTTTPKGRRNKFTVECPTCRKNCPLDGIYQARDDNVDYFIKVALNKLPDNLLMKNFLDTIRKSQSKPDESNGVIADLELDLTVKIRNGETLNLLVKPSFSIKEIKTQIKSLKEIPEKDQVLILNGVILEDANKLAKEQIENCVVWLSYKSREIAVHIFENWNTKKDTVKIEVDWSKNIDWIKGKIFEKKMIPRLWQQIYLGHGIWKEDAKLRSEENLASAQIFRKVVKDGLSLMISGVLSIHDDESNQNLDIEVEAFETFKEIKAKVQLQLQAREKRSKFFCGSSNGITSNKIPELYIRDINDRLKILNGSDKKTLYSFGLMDLFTAKLILTRRPQNHDSKYVKFNIFVKIFPSNQPFKLDCCHADTVENIQGKIYQEKGFPPSEQRLICRGGALREGDTLGYYNIQKDDTLTVILKLRGD